MFARMLGVAFVGFTVVALTLPATGQGKKDTKTTTKAIGAIEVYKNEKGKFRYRVKDDDGKTIAMPLPNMHWESKADCLKAIDELRSILTKVQPADVAK